MKQVRLNDKVDEVLNDLVEHKKTLTPHLTVNKQSVVAELIIKESKKVKK